MNKGTHPSLGKDGLGLSFLCRHHRTFVSVPTSTELSEKHPQTQQSQVYFSTFTACWNLEGPLESLQHKVASTVLSLWLCIWAAKCQFV